MNTQLQYEVEIIRHIESEYINTVAGGFDTCQLPDEYSSPLDLLRKFNLSQIQNVYTNQTVHRTPITYVGDELTKHETHISKGVPDLTTSIQSLFHEVMKDPYD